MRAQRWSTPPCWPPSATSPTRYGGLAPSGVYRLWRDSGYAAGAIVGGLTADIWGLRAAIWAAAAITVASALAVAVRMYETHPASARAGIGN